MSEHDTTTDGIEQLLNRIQQGDEVPMPGRKNPVEVTRLNKVSKNLLQIFAVGSRGGEYKISVDFDIGYVEARPLRDTSTRTGSPVDVTEYIRSLTTAIEQPQTDS